MAELLLDQSEVVAACPVELAGVGVPQTMDRVAAGQTGPRGGALEGLLDRSGRHVSAGVAGHQQRRVRFGWFAESILPKKILTKMILRSLAYADNPLLAALAASNHDGGEWSVQMHVPAVQPGDFHHPQPGFQGQKHHQVVPHRHLAAAGLGLLGPLLRSAKQPAHFLRREELPLIQHPIELGHLFSDIVALLAQRFSVGAISEPLLLSASRSLLPGNDWNRDQSPALQSSSWRPPGRHGPPVSFINLSVQ